MVPAVLSTAGAAPPPQPPVCAPVQQEPTLNCGGRRSGDEVGAKGDAGPANTSNRHQDGAFTRSQKEGGASRGSGSALDCVRPEAGGSSSGSVPHVAAANEVHADHGAARVGWGTERARGSPRRKRGRAAEVQGGEVAATGSGQHARCDHTQIDSARPSLISVCDGGGDVGGAQGSAGGGRDAGRGSGVCGAVVPARGRGDPEARVTMASSEVCRQSDCES